MDNVDMRVAICACSTGRGRGMGRGQLKKGRDPNKPRNQLFKKRFG